MKEGFDIYIKDNFLDEELYKLIYDKIPFYIYGGNYGYHNIEGKLIQEQNNKPEHLFYGAKVEENISNHIKEKCENREFLILEGNQNYMEKNLKKIIAHIRW